MKSLLRKYKVHKYSFNECIYKYINIKNVIIYIYIYCAWYYQTKLAYYPIVVYVFLWICLQLHNIINFIKINCFFKINKVVENI